MEQAAFQWEPQRRAFTVSEFTDAFRALVDEEFADVWIGGEISGCKLAASGHYYFTLKDEEAQLRCVCFRGTARMLRFKPQDGVAVLARGRIDVYAGRGEYQLIVEVLEPQGHGALQFAFEQLKKKLAMEGLFDASRKRALPRFPQRIGIVTSPVGAVIQDMLNVLTRRYPGLHIRLYPAPVQGEGSVEAVSRGIEYFSRSGWADVVIVARGGGSLEDLWTFNEESVARAIAASAAPVISAIGHETDFTIADFVADLRAPTPSAAAELVICTKEQLFDQIAGCSKKLQQWARYRIMLATRRLHQQGIERATSILHRGIGRRAQRVDEIDYSLRDRIRQEIDGRKRRLREAETRLRAQDVRLRFAQARNRLDRAERAITHRMEARLTASDGRLSVAMAHLTQLSPLKVLERGYALVQNEAGKLVKSPQDAPAGSKIKVSLAEGVLSAEVE
jgi:exodeoxyribonuclease VII large subunit